MAENSKCRKKGWGGCQSQWLGLKVNPAKNCTCEILDHVIVGGFYIKESLCQNVQLTLLITSCLLRKSLVALLVRQNQTWLINNWDDLLVVVRLLQSHTFVWLLKSCPKTCFWPPNLTQFLQGVPELMFTRMGRWTFVHTDNPKTHNASKARRHKNNL